MSERVGIVAVAQTKYSANRADAIEGELVYEAVGQVLKETGLKFAKDVTGSDAFGIDATVTCSQDHWDGRTISNCNVMSYIGSHHSDEDKVAEDSLNAVYTAFARILSGHQDVVLVATHCKESQADKFGIENTALDPVFLRVLGLDFLSGAAMQARRYMYKYGITPEQCARVVVKNRANALKNPLGPGVRWNHGGRRPGIAGAGVSHQAAGHEAHVGWRLRHDPGHGEEGQEALLQAGLDKRRVQLLRDALPG